MLMGDEVPPRREFIEANAKCARAERITLRIQKSRNTRLVEIPAFFMLATVV
jgi:hypothetical protein